MLSKSIELNMAISQKYAARGMYALMLSLACGGAILGGIAVFIGIILTVIFLGVSFSKMFNKSMFGEDAYTYMTFPISNKNMLIGKVIVGSFWMMLAAVILVAFLIVEVKLRFPSSSERSVAAFILDIVANAPDNLYDGYSTKAVAFSEATVLVYALVQSILICVVIQLAAIVNHIVNPRKNKPAATAFVIIGAVVGYFAVILLAELLSGLLFEEEYAIGGQILILILELAVGIGLLATSIRLLDRKYNLY